MNNSAEYLVARLRRVLHEDARTAELGIEVTVEGLVVSLAGRVTSDEGRDHIEEVVRETLPGFAVHNEIQVSPPTPPHIVEALGE
ncbi:BON domain-containing protein [Nocardia sp. CDC160]|uniref:BON domain-containing protein n=1 Tax=Nocardia sp. CDC160 TaxID=3112166 RepID=UPI002DB7E2D2|nr:BON domain-containing protein [Nocardia sp. CDC160]MEC3919019.1 BON domain-containing protein [Nocardia sp. CDC160]